MVILAGEPDCGLRAAQQRVERAALGRGQTGQKLDHPLLVRRRHRVESALPLRRQLHCKCSPVTGDRLTLDQSLPDELIGQRR